MIDWPVAASIIVGLGLWELGAWALRWCRAYSSPSSATSGMAASVATALTPKCRHEPVFSTSVTPLSNYMERSRGTVKPERSAFTGRYRRRGGDTSHTIAEYQRDHEGFYVYASCVHDCGLREIITEPKDTSKMSLEEAMGQRP